MEQIKRHNGTWYIQKNGRINICEIHNSRYNTYKHWTNDRSLK